MIERAPSSARSGNAMASKPTAKVPLPPLSQHLREFAQRRDAWIALARNLIPVVGIYLFDWSANLAVFNYWFDGLSGVAAIVAALVPRAMRETMAPPEGVVGHVNQVLAGVATWAFLLAIVALPYWIVLIPLNGMLLDESLLHDLATTPALWATFAVIAAQHFWQVFKVGYDTLPERELRQRCRWDLYLLILRALAMFMMAGPGLALGLVPLMALLLTYFEVWPERVLGAVFGDPSRLWEYDPETERDRKAREERRAAAEKRAAKKAKRR